MTDAEVIERGLRAWAEGDLDALEAVLDPDAQLRAVKPGPWDCTNRGQIRRLLQQRQAERGGARPTEVHVERVAEHTYLVSREDPAGADARPKTHAATKVTIANGRVTGMQQIRRQR